MATRTALSPPTPDPADQAGRWLQDYRARAGPGDALAATADDAAWTAMLEELAAVVGADLGHARERVGRHARDVGAGFRVVGEAEERPWPVSPVPLMLSGAEWAGIAAGVIQRAELIEALLADLYGPARLIADGEIPAALVAGSPLFLRPVVGLTPPGGRHLQFAAFDLGRDPGGGWRVLADHLRAPSGAGYALENRLAVSRTLGGLQTRLNIQRHAPFFASLREGIAALCRRAEPRVALLTPGRFNPSYAEQAHLARYLGFLLVEGADLAALEEQLYVRTIGGLKRIDAVWNRINPRLLDPLAFDTHSRIGVPGLMDAYAAGNLVVANPPGAGVLEAPAFGAFLPRLAELLLGEPLKLPNIATWWCGQPFARGAVEASLDRLLIAPAFGGEPLGLPGGGEALVGDLDPDARAALLADMERRPQDYVGREQARLSTMPAVIGDRLVPRPFTLRVFAARGGDCEWAVLPGGLARIGDSADARAAVIGEGAWSADVCVHGGASVRPVSLLPAADAVRARRNPGTLPSRVADNFFWLGRYLERGEALLTIVRVLLGGSGGDAGGALAPVTLDRLVGLIVAGGAAAQPSGLGLRDLTDFARAALESPDGQSVAAINARCKEIGEGARERLSADMVRLLEAPFPDERGMLNRAAVLQTRYAAIAGLSAEHMGRTAAWRFLDAGRRIERALTAARTSRAFGMAGASDDDLSTLLDLADSQISYRQRYPAGLARTPVVDLVALDPGNPRSLAAQTERLCEHLRALPVLGDDGIAEPQQAAAFEIDASVRIATAATLDAARLSEVERRLGDLSELIARRYFLQGAEPLRASGLTLA